MPKFNLSSGSVYESFRLKCVYKDRIIFYSFMQISCSYEIIICPEYVINILQVNREKEAAVFHGRFLSLDFSVKLIMKAMGCKSVWMGLEEISFSRWSQGQLWQKHLLLLCFSPINSISDVTLLY